MLADVTTIPSSDIDVTDRDGIPWEYPIGLLRTHVVVAIPVVRGGMRRGEISPTQPYDSENENASLSLMSSCMMPSMRMSTRRSPSLLPYWPHDQERPTNPSPPKVWSAMPNQIMCPAWPMMRDDRPHMAVKPFMINGERVGNVDTYSESNAVEVLDQLTLKIRPMRPLKVLPQSANTWSEVHYVMATHIERVPERYCDLRKWPYEMVQKPKSVPVI